MVFGEMLLSFFDEHTSEMANIIEGITNTRIVVFIPVTVFVFMLIYTFLPGKRQSFTSQLPGAVFASVLWVIFSFVFSRFISASHMYSTYYGSLAALMAFLLWLYGIFMILLLGACINCFLSA